MSVSSSSRLLRCLLLTAAFLFGGSTRAQEAGSQGFLWPSAGQRRPIIGAYYFGAYSPEMLRLADHATVHTIAPKPWWGGVADLKDGVGEGFAAWRRLTPEAKFDHLQPSIGFYDNRDPLVAEAHIEQASRHGIEFFNFYWYWGASERRPAASDGLSAFLQARNASRMRFMVSIYAHPWNREFHISENDYAVVARELVALFDRRTYLTLMRRPVVTIGDSRNIGGGGAEDADSFIRTLNRLAKAAGHAKPIVLINPALPYWQQVREAEGAQCLVPNPGLVKPHADYELFTRSLGGYFEGISKTKPLAPCIASNFDERPRQVLFARDAEHTRYFSNQSPAMFLEGLRETQRWQQHQENPISMLLTVYAWNEWHEGGIIEPNVRDGSLYLELIDTAFRTQSLRRYSHHDGMERITTLRLPSSPWRLLEIWNVYNSPSGGGARRPLFECSSGVKGGTVVSLDPHCGGQRVVRFVGYIVTDPRELRSQGKAIFRCVTSAREFFSSRADCGHATELPGVLLGFSAD